MPYGILYITQVSPISINKPVLNKVPTDNLLANYVLPSMKNLNELNEYSRIENLNGIQYRVPKDALFEGESKEDYQDISITKKDP